MRGRRHGAYPSPPPYAVAPVPRERVYRDDEAYERDYPGPRRYSHADPGPPYGGRCLPRELVKDRLVREGWRDFHDGD